MQQQSTKILWDAVAGLVMIVVAIAFLFFGSRLSFGSLTEMGPGFFPLCTAGILLVLGVATVLEGLRSAPVIPEFPQMRPFLVIVACPIVFASMIGWAGMVPTVLVTSLLARFAEPFRLGWDLVLVPIALVALSVIVFIEFLGVAIPIF